MPASRGTKGIHLRDFDQKKPVETADQISEVENPQPTAINVDTLQGTNIWVFPKIVVPPNHPF